MNSYAVDSNVTLEINGTKQSVRICSERYGLPPVLIVQAGPGLPLLNEAAKFQRRLRLEQHFSVAYWDQRGCGRAALGDIENISLETQIDDLRAVVSWLAREAGQDVVVLAISLGATTALQAAAQDACGMKALVAISIDADTLTSDNAAYSFLQEVRIHAGEPLMKKLGAPPYTTPAPFQLRARLLANLGCIERRKQFPELLRSLLFSLIRTYGLFGAAKALRNMHAIQRELLPELARLNLFRNWPRPAIPVHYVFGGSDPLIPHSMVKNISKTIMAADTTLTLPDAAHMAHFDEPAVVRAIVARAHSVA